MEVDRYCNECLGYYSYDVDETDNFKKCRWCGSEDTEEAQKFSVCYDSKSCWAKVILQLQKNKSSKTRF